MFILGTSTVVAYVPQSSIDFIAPIPQTMRAALGQTGIGNLIAMTAILLIEGAPAGRGQHDLHRRNAPADDRRLG
jgi:hypothetical protein